MRVGELGIRVGRVQVADPDPLVAVRHEGAREAGQAEPGQDVAARRLLRERADVVDRPVEDVDAAGDRAVEQVRLAERQLVVLVALAGQHRQRQRFALAEEIRRLEGELGEGALELRHAGAERQLVAVLLLELQGDVDLVLLARRLVDLDVLVALERLEVAELIEVLDALLERLGVEDAALDQLHLAADHVVVRGAVAEEGDAVDEVLLALLHVHRHVDDGRAGLALGHGRGGGALRLFHVARLGVLGEVAEREVGEGGELEVADRAVDLARLLHALADALLRVVGARLQVRRPAPAPRTSPPCCRRP